MSRTNSGYGAHSEMVRPSDPAQHSIQKKMQERRTRWEWNSRLALGTGVGLTIFFALAIGSYFFNSAKTADTFLERARLAKDEGRFDEQAKWLSRYSLMDPAKENVVIEMAIAADNAADAAGVGGSKFTDDDARKYLGDAIARLSDESKEEREELRKRLINRLLKLGGPWLVEAIRQVNVLSPENPNDPEALRWVALALAGQVNESMYSPPTEVDKSQSKTHWEKLAQEKVGEVIFKALESKENSQDEDLLGNLVEISNSNPGYFDGVEKQNQNEIDALNSRVKERLKAIEDRSNSRAILILNQFDDNLAKSGRNRNQVSEASLARFARFVEPAVLRLESYRVDETKTVTREQPAELWDFFLVARYARQLEDNDPNLAVTYYDRLLSCDESPASKSLLEGVYVRYGLLEANRGNEENAFEVWRRGLENVKSDSLGLLSSIARLEAEQNLRKSQKLRNEGHTGKIEFSTESVSRLKTAIENSAKQVATAPNLSQLVRKRLGREVDAAKWRLNVMEAFYDSLEGRTQDAIRKFESALVDKSVENPAERSGVFSQLANLYQQQGALDLAASTLDRAVETNPGNPFLRAQAAEVWTVAGNRLRAIDQWKIAANSGSLLLRIYSIEARYNYQLRLPPEDRDFSGVRSLIDKMRANPELKNRLNGQDSNIDLRRAASRLETIDLLIPPSGTTAEQHLDSRELAEAIGELAEKYSEDERMQVYAAERFAASGNVEKAEEILDSIDASASSSTKQSVEVARARIDADQGNFSQSFERISKLARENPGSQAAMYRMAAKYALNGNDIDSAYQALTSIPESERTYSTLFLLSTISESLAPDSRIVKAADKSPQDLAKQWRDELEAIEGEQGTFWRYLDTQKKIRELEKLGYRPNPNDPDLLQAKADARNIVTRRPQWGNALTLNAMLAVIEGKDDEAIELFRRGIASGDTRRSTRQLLIKLLVANNRFDEARQVILRSQWMPDQATDKSVPLIELAQREGNFDESLRLARVSVANSPEDVSAHIVLGMTAIIAAKGDQDKREAYLQEAELAIEKASQLADENDTFKIEAARLNLLLERGDEVATRKQLEKIQKSNIDDLDKTLLVTRGLISLEDLESALALLEGADEQLIASRGQAVQIGLLKSELYRRLNRPDQQISELRKAVANNPTNVKLKSDLARAIATRDAKDIDWKELKDLLDPNTSPNSENRLLFAIILIVHGEDKNKEQAQDILEEIIKERNAQSDDARRMLAVLFREKIDKILEADPISQEDQSRLDQLMEQTRFLYGVLCQKAPPDPADVYRHADFLLRHGNENDLARIGNLSDTLEQISNSALSSIEIKTRFLTKSGREDKIVEAMDSWIGSANGAGVIDPKDISSIAAASLVGLGFIDEGLSRLENAYRENPQLLGNYVVLLNNLKKTKQAVSICSEHHKKHDDVDSVVLLVESLLNDPSLATAEIRKVIEQCVEQNKGNAMLLESVATLFVQEDNYAEAVRMYHMIDQIEQNATKRIRTLNNLAIAYSELNGKESSGLEPIDRAIKIANRHPELLDTKGIVLLRAGKPEEAEKTFRSAIRKKQDARFQFHLVLSLLAQEKNQEAQLLWESINLDEIAPGDLARRGRLEFIELKQKFSSESTQ